jgi:hypothetical protein
VATNKQKKLLCQFVSMFFVFRQKNIAQKPVEGRKTVEEAFSCTPPEIVNTAKEPECTLPEHELLFKNRHYCTFNVNIVNNYNIAVITFYPPT